ncbi:MAG TPA: N-acyl homoserine lactonase family protein [Ktedonosporobacter sp.]|nr:N-acyl homoserine lactonase family protein [Ktedonosporobacter sp.]
MTTHTSTPQRLYLIQIAARSAPEATWPVPYPCYLVQMSDGKNILIDTGFPKDLPPRPELELRKNVVEQLALLDLQPDDIDILICTHFDLDHCGHHEDFPKTEHIVQRQHYEVAREGHPRYGTARAHWDHPALHYRLVDGDTELLPGLTLIETDGHAPGHQSVLVRLPETGLVLLTIDAVANQGFFKPDRQAGPMDVDGEKAIVSTRKLLALVQREQVALTIFGHDGAQWATLKKLPEYYQ